MHQNTTRVSGHLGLIYDILFRDEVQEMVKERVGMAYNRTVDIEGLENEILKLAKRKRYIHGIRVMHKHKEIYCKGFNGHAIHQLHAVYSCTKSVMATLIGIAIDRGMIPSVETHLADLLPKYECYLKGNKAALTLKHLLMMRSGLEWNELNDFGKNDGLWDRFLKSEDAIAFVLDRPLSEEPGQKYNYSSGVSHLLSAILMQCTQMATQQFAQKYLFDPLGIESNAIRWKADFKGIAYGGHGLEMTLEDLSKLGLLYLQEGVYESHRIVSRNWIQETLRNYSTQTRGYDGYGYQWWLGKVEGHWFYGAFGHGGQRVYVFKEEELVVTFLGKVQPEFGIQERLIRKYIRLTADS